MECSSRKIDWHDDSVTRSLTSCDRDNKQPDKMCRSLCSIMTERENIDLRLVAYRAYVLDEMRLEYTNQILVCKGPSPPTT